MTVTAAPSQLARLAGLPLSDRQVALWWFGQSMVALRAAGLTLLFDPFLSPHPDRLVPPPFAPEDASGIDVVLCTHDHLDHLDGPALPGIAAASPDCIFVVPEPIVPVVRELGIAPVRIVGAQPDSPIILATCVVHPVPASHGDEPADAYGFGGDPPRFLGYVIEAAGTRVYHAGDTIPFDGIEDVRCDVALLPINGRDAEREAQGIVGNLNEEEAAHVAAAIGADVLVPLHYDMFAANPGDPARVVAATLREPRATVLVLTRERPFVYTRA